MEAKDNGNDSFVNISRMDGSRVADVALRFAKRTRREFPVVKYNNPAN
jgi:hypothetical protein